MSLASVIQQVTASLQQVKDEIPELQVYGYWNDQPSPPCLDVFPGNPFQNGAGFGAGNNEVFLTVRARVAMADAEEGQQLLLRMLDSGDLASVEVALADADAVVVSDGVSGYTQYADDNSANERMLGCEWRCQKFL